MSAYLRAAQRHLASGDVLDNAGQMVDSSHLWAYGAECAIKALIEKRGPITCAHKTHINEHLSKPTKTDLAGYYNANIAGRLAFPLPCSLFTHWTVHERYEDGTAVKPHHSAHKADRQIIGALLSLAVVRGELP